MRIGPANPGYVMRAYGVKPPAVSKPTPAVQPAAAPPRTAPEQTVSTAATDRLVAGAVRGAVDFNQASPIQPANPLTLQLYTRAADKVEAATAVRLGQSIDVRG